MHAVGSLPRDDLRADRHARLDANYPAYLTPNIGISDDGDVATAIDRTMVAKNAGWRVTL